MILLQRKEYMCNILNQKHRIKDIWNTPFPFPNKYFRWYYSAIVRDRMHEHLDAMRKVKHDKPLGVASITSISLKFTQFPPVEIE